MAASTRPWSEAPAGAGALRAVRAIEAERPLWDKERSEIYITDGAACMGLLRSGAGDLPLLNAFKGAILASKPADAS
jgi:hypothetical protein